MTYPMLPELLEQLGLEPCTATDPLWLEDHDALGWGRRLATIDEIDEPDRGVRVARQESPNDQ